MSSPTYKKVAFKYWYPLVTRLLRNDDVPFLNWAYEEDPPMALPLEASDEPNRAHINLYHRVATQADLSGKKVLEVSCGHGGGASYIMRSLHPASYTGLDLNARAIELSRQRHNLPGLDFVQGDAENLPFDDESFDVVLNIESSHCYPHFPRFLAEVVRVLRPGGHFLYADIRFRGAIARWEAELADTPMRQLSLQVINEQVLRGLDNNTQRSQDLVRRNAPAAMRFLGRNFAAVQGTPAYCLLQNGSISYRMYSFTKD
jgi:ubiquinone/menaquinone biosynthesis C-methylase UbiE